MCVHTGTHIMTTEFAEFQHLAPGKGMNTLGWGLDSACYCAVAAPPGCKPRIHGPFQIISFYTLWLQQAIVGGLHEWAHQIGYMCTGQHWPNSGAMYSAYFIYYHIHTLTRWLKGPELWPLLLCCYYNRVSIATKVMSYCNFDSEQTVVRQIPANKVRGYSTGSVTRQY